MEYSGERKGSLAMNKTKRRWIIFVILLCLCVVVGKYAINESNYVKQGEIKEYVNDNSPLLTEFAVQIMNNQQEVIEVYRKKSEYPITTHSLEIYKCLRIDRMAVYKDCYDDADRVKIYLKNKPQSEDYYACGIYYSPNDTIIDYFGDIQDGDSFEYDGTPNGTKIKYKSEKICDYWYYFEEAVWN